MNLSSAPYIAAALAAERHGRFLTEAQHARRLSQLDSVRGRDTTAAWFMRAVRVKVMTKAVQMESGEARHRLRHWARLGQA